MKKISDEVTKAAQTEGVKKIIESQGGDLVAGTPAQFAGFIDAERKRYETIVREAGMQVD